MFEQRIYDIHYCSTQLKLWQFKLTAKINLLKLFGSKLNRCGMHLSPTTGLFTSKIIQATKHIDSRAIVTVIAVDVSVCPHFQNAFPPRVLVEIR